MADHYVSSVAYAAIPAFVINTAYSVGDIIRPTAAAAVSRYPQRCTTAGTTAGSEPTWNNNNNGTTTSGTATFTNVGGQSAYGWGAACGTVASLSGVNIAGNKELAAGDRLFASSDHSESGVAANYRMNTTASLANTTKIISVNRAGSVPPVAADVQSGAAITVSTNTFIFEGNNPHLWHGFTFTQAGAFNFYFADNNRGFIHFKNCAFVITSTSPSIGFRNGSNFKVVFDNTTIQLGHVSQYFRGVLGVDFTWINTPSAIVGATIPTGLFKQDVGSGPPYLLTCRGVDFSAITGTLVVAGTNASSGAKILLDSCKINASATILGSSSSSSSPAEEVELVNCFDGTNIISSRHAANGTLTTDITTYMTGGAEDDVGNYSHKMVSSANCEYLYPLESFWLDVENTAVGTPMTATVQIVSSASLNNTDIRLQLEYEGTSGSSFASFVESQESVLTASAALTTSSATWNSPPGTPVYQQISVTFTPQTAGRVRGKIMLGKPSTTVWVNPQIALS